MKPVEHKLFSGRVIGSRSALFDLIESPELSEETEVWQSEVVDFTSEFRIFVKDGQFLSIKTYEGSPFDLPKRNNVLDLVFEASHSKELPSTFCIDLGVIGDRPELIEVNDAFSAGAYGLPSKTYADFLLSRWKELRNENS